MSRYRVDGLFINRWDGSGIRYCQHCVANFKDATGFDLPARPMSTAPVIVAYLLCGQERLISQLDVWNAEIRKINPEAAVIPNNGSRALTPPNALETSRLAPTIAADRQARHGLAAPWLIGTTRGDGSVQNASGDLGRDLRPSCNLQLRLVTSSIGGILHPNPTQRRSASEFVHAFDRYDCSDIGRQRDKFSF